MTARKKAPESVRSNPLEWETLKALIHYDPETGVITRLTTGCPPVDKRVAGRPAGYQMRRGHVIMNLFGKLYLAHRVAFVYMTGQMPAQDIDHINGDKADNRWANLRLATPSQNGANRGAQKNSATGVKGVWPAKRGSSRWRAGIRIDGKSIHLGTFDTKEEASEAYAEAAVRLFGEFARAA